MRNPGYGLHGDFLQGWSNQTALEQVSYRLYLLLTPILTESQAVYTCQGNPDSAPCSVADGIGPAVAMPPTIPAYVEDVGLKAPISSLPGVHPIVGTYADRLPALK